MINVCISTDFTYVFGPKGFSHNIFKIGVQFETEVSSLAVIETNSESRVRKIGGTDIWPSLRRKSSSEKVNIGTIGMFVSPNYRNAVVML